MAFSTDEYEWSEVLIALSGVPEDACTKLTYEQETEKEYSYARGDKPRSIQHGNVSNSGSIGLLQSALEKLQKVAPDNNVMKMVFDITCAYVSKKTGKIVTDTLIGCEFTKQPKGMSQGDKRMEIEMPIMYLDVKHDAT